MKYKGFFLILFIANYYVAGFCQGPEWINYTITNIPRPTLAIDNSDIWTCTRDGIIRVNKFTDEIISYNHANSFLNFIPSQLFADQDQQIWFYDSKNIAFYKNEQWGEIPLDEYLGAGKYINKVIVSESERIYLSTYYNNAVYELVNDSLRHIFTSEIPWPEDHIMDIDINSGGELWIAGIGYVICLNETDTIIYNSSNSPLPNGFMEKIYVDNTDNVWVIPEGYDNGDISVLRFNGVEWTYWEESVFADYDIFFNSISEDEYGSIYLSSFNGLFKFENENWMKITDISSDKMTIDYESNLWCISNDQINRKTESGWKTYDLITNELDPQSNYCISGVLNTIYIGGKNRIAQFDGFNWYKFSGVQEVTLVAISDDGIVMALINGKIYVRSETISWQYVTHDDLPDMYYDFHRIYVDLNNEFWIGTNTGLFHFQNNELRKELDFRINDIDQDSNGIFWLATENGLIKYNGEILETFNSDNSNLASDFISHLSVSKTDEIWLSVQEPFGPYPPYYSVKSYLTKFENDVFKDYDTINGGDWGGALRSDFPIDKIVTGENNDAWVKYKYEGLMHFKDEVFTLYNYENSGIADNTINDLIIDSDSNVFILHERAMSIFNQNGINLNVDKFIDVPKHYIYPNPSNGKFSIVFDRMINEYSKINICDQSGRLVKKLSKKISANKLDLNLNGLKSGLYFYFIVVNKNYYSGKMIIIY